MRKLFYSGSRVSTIVHRAAACCVFALLVCSCHAQKQLQTPKKDTRWIDWTIEYKGVLTKEEKAKLYSTVESYVRDQLVKQKTSNQVKKLNLNYTESGNAIRVTSDGSIFATGSIVVGPHPPPPPIIPNDQLRRVNAKIAGAKNM